MIIHIVKEGDTIDTLAQSYGVEQQRIMLDNEIASPADLVLGEALVILQANTMHTVREGETLGTIAAHYHVTVQQLLRNNPYLSGRQYIYPGENLVIEYKDEKRGTLAVDGYAYPFINLNMLQKTLPFLTYLTIYSYQVKQEGTILNVEDRELIRLSKAYGVAPIMMLTGSDTTEKEEIEAIHSILHDKGTQKYFMEQLLFILKDKGYYGVNMNTPYILPEDRELYVDFIEHLASGITEKGYKVFISLSLSAFEMLTGVRYQGLRYDRLGKSADYIMLISYDWGADLGIPSGIVHHDTLKKFYEQSVQLMSPEKILSGISCIGHIWSLPYESGETMGMAISYQAAIQIAKDNNMEILYDQDTLAAYYQYIDKEEYIVRFRDARSMDSLIRMSSEFGTCGIGIWNIMIFFPQLWLVVNAQYEIQKVL